MFRKKINNEICLQTLKEICKKYEIDEYSIGLPVEQKVCLCKRGDNWEVFIVERGIEFDKVKYKECIDACIEVIKYCAYSIEEFKDASNEFKNLLLSKLNVNKCKNKIKK